MAVSQPLAAQESTYYFPHLAVGGEWQTTITYINYSPQEVRCETDFTSDDGSPLMVSFADRGTRVDRTDLLPPGGSVHEETNVALSAPEAGGWARATCSGPVKASLLYRLYNSEGLPTGEAGVNAATVPATRFVTFAEQGEGEGKHGTGVAYANPSDTTTAFVTFTVRDAAGNELPPSATLTLLPRGHDAKNMVDLFDLPSFTGSLEVTSTAPIVSLSLNNEAAPVFSSLPPGELDAAVQGTPTYYFPHLAVGGEWQTTLTYVNVSAQTVTCDTNFFKSTRLRPDTGIPLLIPFEGDPAAPTRNDVLLPSGSIHVESTADLNGSPLTGWALARCTGPVKASLLYRRRDSDGVTVAEAGVNATTTLTSKFVTFAEWGGGEAYGTGIALASPSLFPIASFAFAAFNMAGVQVVSSGAILFARGHTAFNLGPALAAAFAEKGITSFQGSIHILSTVPVISLSLNNETDPVFSSLPPGDLDPATVLATSAANPVP